MIRLDEIKLKMTTLKRIEVAPIEEKMIEIRLRWFEYVGVELKKL